MIHYYSAALGIACGTASGVRCTNNPFHVNCPHCLTQLTAFGLMPKKEEPTMDPIIKDTLDRIRKQAEHGLSEYDRYSLDEHTVWSAVGWQQGALSSILASLDALETRLTLESLK